MDVPHVSLKSSISGSPVIAILTMSSNLRAFRGDHQNFIDLIRVGTENGALVYVTRVKDLKFGERKINGFLYHPVSKTWTQTELPFPEVIYNRIPSRKDEQHPRVQQKLQSCLKHAQVRMFNPAYFTKWTLFEWLNQSRSTNTFVPATKRVSTSGDLEMMLQQHQTVYLKPIRGKAGIGIMRVEGNKSITSSHPFFLRVQDGRKTRLSSFRTLNELWQRVSQEMGDEEYIMQQGISLSSHKKRPFDLRVLVQKNGKGEWTLTGIGARVAGKNSITTHVPRGGHIDFPDKVLTNALGSDQAKKTLMKAKKAALSIARQIEKASGHQLGEMSMDLGVDTDGKIWFFEANSHPMKFDEPDIRKKSLERIIQYSTFLTKSSKKSR